MKKIASSSTLSGIEKLVNQYFYSQHYRISEDLVVTNFFFYKTDIVIIKKEKSKYVFYIRNNN
jgi:hypothetical protein